MSTGRDLLSRAAIAARLALHGLDTEDLAMEVVLDLLRLAQSRPGIAELLREDDSGEEQDERQRKLYSLCVHHARFIEGRRRVVAGRNPSQVCYGWLADKPDRDSSKADSDAPPVPADTVPGDALPDQYLAALDDPFLRAVAERLSVHGGGKGDCQLVAEDLAGRYGLDSDPVKAARKISNAKRVIEKIYRDRIGAPAKV